MEKVDDKCEITLTQNLDNMKYFDSPVDFMLTRFDCIRFLWTTTQLPDVNAFSISVYLNCVYKKYTFKKYLLKQKTNYKLKTHYLVF